MKYILRQFQRAGPGDGKMMLISGSITQQRGLAQGDMQGSTEGGVCV